jgi:hypothetical protein
VILAANGKDAERLAAESLPGLSAAGDDPRQLVLELDDTGSDAADEDAPQVAKTVIEACVRHINGSGKLRWGRAFEGVAVSAVQSVGSDGRVTQHVFPPPAIDHMLPEDFADLVEQFGFQRPGLPFGIEIVNALDLAAVTSLAETNPDVGRVLHLVALMLEGDGEINWVAGYAALETITHDLAGLEMTRFR